MNTSYQRGLILHQQGRHADAARELRQALATDPHDAQAHALLGLCLSELEDFDAATQEAGIAVGIAPWLGFTHYVMALVLYKRNRLDQAQAAIAEAIRLEPQHASYLSLLAAMRFELRDWPGALEAAERGLQSDPDHVGCINIRAMALVKLGRRAEAGASIGAALSRNPENATTHANQGWTLLHQGKHQEALEHFREALRLDPQHQWARQGIVEALKSRHFVYRWLLMYFLWMARLSGRAQWGIVLGAYVGAQVLQGIVDKHPATGRYLWPILIAYIVFVALTWLANPLFNLLLRLSKFGRLVLTNEQITASNWIGGVLLAALLAGGAFLVTRRQELLMLTIDLAVLVLPLSGMFRCPKGWPRWVMMAVCAALAFLGLGTVGLMAALPSLTPPMQEMLLEHLPDLSRAFIYGVLGAQFASNYLVGVRVRR